MSDKNNPPPKYLALLLLNYESYIVKLLEF